MARVRWECFAADSLRPTAREEWRAILGRLGLKRGRTHRGHHELVQREAGGRRHVD